MVKTLVASEEFRIVWVGYRSKVIAEATSEDFGGRMANLLHKHANTYTSNASIPIDTARYSVYTAIPSKYSYHLSTLSSAIYTPFETGTSMQR